MILLAATTAMLAAGCGAPVRERIAIDHFVRGQMLADQGKLDEALRELALAVQTNPELSVAHAAMGDIHRRRGDYQQARGCYEQACQANPYAFRPQYNLAVVYQLLAAAAKTVERMQECLRRAAGVYLRALAIDPEDFEANLNISACYFALGKHALAERYCKTAIAVRPDSAEAHSNLGVIYDSQGRCYEAIKAYKDSLEVDTHQPKLWMNLGATYARQGRLKSAEKAYEVAAREDANSPEPWERLGGIYLQQIDYRTAGVDDYAKALAAYQKAAALDKASAGAYYGIGLVYMSQYHVALKRGQQQPELRERALAAWHTSLELDPKQPKLIELVQKFSPKVTGPEM